MSGKKGKFIVIDGIDGSGKATQVSMLYRHLLKEGIKVKTIDFPRYQDNLFGGLIGEYLTGKFGDFIQTDPRIASVLYAADRFEASREIRKWLEAGYTVVADRYVSANQIHQGGKIKSISERKKFLKWLDQMEYGVFQIPKPDLVIFLDVPYEVSKSWLEQKVARRKNQHLKGKKDVAEDNLLHLKNSRLSALTLASENKSWEKINCCQGMICLPAWGVHDKVFEIVEKKLKLK